ncbi:PREDICTED: uncharacterized protein LOC106819665, partial [Priapulus caudatus]|uniref:Uncharacterized protein LOC106819665 n=1 Tax=Priapulus caudatus TaxID=37621 RepID=A0ABM1F5M8_PRICU
SSLPILRLRSLRSLFPSLPPSSFNISSSLPII